MMRAETDRIRRGFTLVEIVIVVLIIGILLTVAAPAFLKARAAAHARSCQSNLKQIIGAKERWAMEAHKGATDEPSWNDLVPTYIKREPSCPAAGTYTIGDMSTPPVCSIGGQAGEYDAHVLE